MGEGECEAAEVSTKRRHRKKQLYNSILKQMEFYFSDSNLSKDRFLSQLLTESPEIDINVFLSFNKIKKLNCTIDDIRKAISKSELIKLSEDNEKIIRKNPVKIKENVDECTIYVENIKAEANHEWLNRVFSEFGNVAYVSIPKYKLNKGNKGFAFIEFETEKEARSALEYFESIGCKMPSEIDPGSLKSISTFEEQAIESEETEEGKEDNSKKEEIEENPKKRKLETQELDEQEEKVDKKMKNETELPEKMEPNVGESKKKKHKKDKKKAYIKELGLQILSKHEWKKMRNRYLDLQRKKMKEFKQYLFKQKLNQNRKDMREETAQIFEENPTVEDLPKLEYVSGVIVKLKLPEPCIDVKKLKNEIKAVSPEVKYVDIPLPAGSEEVFVRFATPESAQQFCSQDGIGEKNLLEDNEEKLYWNKIENDRTVKFNKSKTKQRGREKLLKKAEKERAKHLRFDDGD